MKKGILYGVGVGPGDPELLTLKAVHCLAACPVIAYPAPPQGQSLARRIAAPYLDSQNKTEIVIRIPLTQNQFTAPQTYANACARLATHLEKGDDVAVLCLGDPLLYGSFIYLLQGMKAGYQTRMIPGVSAITAVASTAMTPLAIRDETLLIVPATLQEDQLEAHIAQNDAIIFIKVGHHLAKLKTLLSRLRLDHRALYIERASFEEETCLPLAASDPQTASYFSIILLRKQPLL